MNYLETMNMKNTARDRDGLILLVVLGMLSLFSLLAISFMVVSSQSRASNFGRARRDFRGTPPAKLLDATIRQVLRGTQDTNSVWWHNSLLGDLYGNAVIEDHTAAPDYSTADGVLQLESRLTLRDNPNRLPAKSGANWGPSTVLPIPASALEAPRILEGHYMRIPLQWTPVLPKQHDAWNGRILTFLEGPLQGQSYRVIRYLGEVELTTDLPTSVDRTSLHFEQASQYSVTIDLAESDLQLISINGGTRNFADWLNANINGFSLCYASSTDAYSMMLNSAPQNSVGYGFAQGAIDQTMANAALIPALSHLAAPQNAFPPASATQPYRNLSTALAINLSHIHRGNLGFEPTGDADESYDAADFSNPAMSFRHRADRNGNLMITSEDIIPAMHRPALINYIYAAIADANPPRGSSFNPIDLVSTIELLQRASGRPLSWRITNFPLGPNNILQQNPGFTGTNQGEFASPTGAQSPQLDINWANWSNASGSGPSEQDKFEAWVRWLQKGPWDVDNDADGITDSVWTEINGPLMTSREGKLLKALAAVYIDDLGGRLDINATGSIQQAATAHSNFTATDAFGYFNPNDRSVPQGLGFGTADISLQHLFSTREEYLNFMRSRNAEWRLNNKISASHLPGALGNDLLSEWRERNRSSAHFPASLPGLPSSVVGRSGLSIDLFGNPILFENTALSMQLNQIVDDPYESMLNNGGHFDSHFTIGEWERLYRAADHDRSTLPRRLQDLLFPPGTPFFPADIAAGASALSPRSRSLLAPRFAGSYIERLETSATPNPRIRRVNSFTEAMESLAQSRWGIGTTPVFSKSVLSQLFPVEFRQNLPLNLNRPLGNGMDDNGNGMVDEPAELAGHGIDDGAPSGSGGFRQDDNGDGVIDDPAEVDERDEAQNDPISHQLAEGLIGPYGVEHYTYSGEDAPANLRDETMFYSNPESAIASGANHSAFDKEFRDYANDLTGSPVEIRSLLRTYNGDQSRQLMARHLYCLAQLILPDEYIFPGQDQSSAPPTAYPYGSIERARILAQWAVNVVDFRDADHVMTRFAFDPEPFGSASGSSLNIAGAGWKTGADNVVWGYEAPDLLMTESLAFHDTRITMEANKVAGSNRREFNPDAWRQVRRPEGSLFLEFFCPRSNLDNAQSIPRNSPEVGARRYWTADYELNLGMVTPPDPVTNEQFPVWRVALLAPQPLNSPTPVPFDMYKDPATRGLMQYQLANPSSGLTWDSLASPSTPVVERVVWFADLPATPGNLASPQDTTLTVSDVYRYQGDGRVEVNRGGNLVIGPRFETSLGQRQPRNPNNNPPLPEDVLPDEDMSYPAEYHPSDQSINIFIDDTSTAGIDESSVELNNFSYFFTAPNTRTAIIQSDQPAGAFYPGLNISEPDTSSYYKLPSHNSNPGGMFPFPEMDGYVSRATDAFATPSDTPEDLNIGLLVQGMWDVVDDSNTPPTPIRPAFRSRMNWSTAILQRLANPDRPWHEALNPYITIDWLPIDLTVFSGEVNDFEIADAQNHHRIKSIDGADLALIDDPNTQGDDSIALVDDPTTPNIDESLVVQQFRLNSRQKTGVSVRPEDLVDLSLGTAAIDTSGGRTFYSYHTENSFTNPPKDPTPEVMPDPTAIRMNFEFEMALPPSVDAGRVDTSNGRHTAQWVTLGDLNCRFGLRGVDGGTANANYPRAAVFTPAGGAPTGPVAPFWPDRDYVSSLDIVNVPMSSPGQLMQEFSPEQSLTLADDIPFRHLFDFEMNRRANAGSTLDGKRTAAQLLALVGTRNPWSDSEVMLDPYDALTPGPGLSASQQTQNALMSIYRAPFNAVPTYVEPGKVNLNTVSNSDVFRGLMWGEITPRSAKNDRSTNVLHQNAIEAGRATDAQSPFAYTSGVDNMSNTRLNAAVPTQFPGVSRSPFSYGTGATPELKLPNAADVGLLRSNRATPRERLLTDATAPYNAMLKNRSAARLQNLTSSDSHTYAVRVTIGFFEYDPSTGLGQEYGIDEGTAMRHRGFYLIDRSIPVGYREGYDLNTDKCIIMRRVIE